MPRTRWLGKLLGVSLLALVGRGEARAHWCDDIFATSYNVVVRPERDSVAVPSTGSATLNVWVQNNLGYPLQSFAFTASASGYQIAVSRDAPKVTGYLMPGENLRHILTITRSGGATLAVENITFYVAMGPGGQSVCYGRTTCGIAQNRAVVLRKTTGSLVPAGPLEQPPVGDSWDQAEHLRHAAQADFGDINVGLDRLMTTYCAGRLTWGYQSVVSACCPNPTTTICPPASCNSNRAWSSLPANDAGEVDGPHLWAAGELAVRKSQLGARIGPFRERLRCSWNDPFLLIRAYAAFVLGYLGEDAQSRTFLEGIISSGSASAENKAVAKASLLLFKAPADLTAYRTDVTGNLTSSNAVVAIISAGALGIADRNDAPVNDVLIPRARWSYPFDGQDAVPVFAAEILNLVAWDRRIWTPGAGDTGRICFYESCGPADTTRPRPPANVGCSTPAGGQVTVSWSQVTLDVNGNPETMGQYRVYSGVTGRPGGCTRPAECGGFDYDHVDPTAAITRDFSGLDGTRTHFFTVTAVDAAGNASDYGAEVSCKPRYAPVARINCAPTSGDVPLTVTCDGNGSTDANGNADIVTYRFQLDTQTPQEQNPVTYNFTTAGGHTVVLTVIDSTGLSSTATASVTGTTPGGNRVPTAAAVATPTTGRAPLAVTFSSAGSTDPDSGQTLSFLWNFADGSPTSTQANPSHTFTSAGTYNVMLTVTDDGTPAMSDTDVASVVVTGNSAPNVQPATASPQSGTVPLAVRFDASQVRDPEGDRVTLTWTFGDGTPTSSLATVNHTYAAVGTYTAELAAQDNGLPAVPPARKSFTIAVQDRPPANRPPDCSKATVTPTLGRAPFTVTLDASGCADPDNDALTYLWRVPTAVTTEDTFSAATVTYEFLEPAIRTITLSVSDNAASPMETTKTFEVTILRAADQAPALGGSCGCAAAGVPISGVGLLLWGFTARRRRRS